jgi:hypothetical protein
LFDDDEEEAPQVAEGEDEEPSGIRAEEGEGEPDDKDLTEFGKELRNLLKNHRKDDDMSDTSDTFESDSDDEDDFNIEANLPPILYPKNLNLIQPTPAPEKQEETPINIKVEPKESALAPQEEVKPRTPPSQIEGEREKRPEEKPKARPKKKGKGKEEAKPEAKAEVKTEAKKGKAKKTGTKRPTETNPAPPSTAQPPAAKKAKTEPAPKTESAKAPPKPPSPPIVTEDDIRKVLKEKGKMRTIELINHFKTALQDRNEKTKFTDIIKKMAYIVEENGVKLLVLKNEYK